MKAEQKRPPYGTVDDMSSAHLYPDVDRARARSTLLGTFTIIVLVGTLVLDLGPPIGMSVWASYCLAIVLALQWKGRPAIAAVTVMAMLFMFIDLWVGPGGNLEIGIVTITGVALICLYIDWKKHRSFVGCQNKAMRQSVDPRSVAKLGGRERRSEKRRTNVEMAPGVRSTAWVACEAIRW